MVLSVLSALALLSCVREEVQEESQGGNAYIVAPATRTDFDSYAGKFTWSDGDRIAIHLTDGTFYETTVNAQTGAFLCSTTPSKQRDAYAVYPASVRDDDYPGTPVLKVVLPAEYDLSMPSGVDYSPVPMIAVNRQGEDDLFFRHVGGLFRITCDRIPAGTQKIVVTFDRNIAGSFTVVDPASEAPMISDGGDTQSVTFKMASTALARRTDGITLNIPVPVGAYASLSIEAQDAAGTRLYSTERRIEADIPRSHGKKYQFPPVEEASDSMQMVVTAGASTGWTFALPFLSDAVLPSNLSVDWGDGSCSSAPVGAAVGDYASAFTHTYSTAGDYTVTVEASGKVSGGPFIPHFSFYRTDDPTLFQTSRGMLKDLPTPLLKMEGDGEMLFRGCSRLKTVCGDLLSKNPQFTTLDRLFLDAGLTGIPAGLFDYSPAVKTLLGVFGRCTGLSSIPAGLFDHCLEVENMSSMFLGCSNLTGPIPAGLFDHNGKAATFAYLFQNCSRLGGSIPADLFAHTPDVTDFSYTFSGCSQLNGPIPEGLFDTCPRVTTFAGTFELCDALSGSIPAGLFDHNPEVTTFRGTFSNCHNLTGPIPTGLFDHCPKVTSFGWTFNQCQKISGSIPAGLFDNNLEVTDFNVTFSNCYALSGEIPHGLFRKHSKAVLFGNTFGCYYGNSTAANLIVVDDVFIGGEVTRENRFASYTEPVYFYQCFSKLKQGTAPDLWNYTYGNGYDSQQCFVYCTSFSNFNAIPDAWKY